MTEQEILAYVAIFGALTKLGETLVSGVRAIVRAARPGVTDAELDAIEDGIAADAARRRREREAMTGESNQD